MAVLATSAAMRVVAWLALAVALLLSGPLLTLAFGNVSIHGDWRTATHRSTGLAPDAALHPEAVVQAYASRTFGWRGAFAVHTWIAAKPAHAERYTRYEVIGWYSRGGGSGLSVTETASPDAEWYGARPYVIRDLRGAAAEDVIARLEKTAEAYPYSGYRAWPGPNSNTFIAYLAREIPEFQLGLPSLAIGKDYVPAGRWLVRAPSGTGWQLSLGGILGVTLARVEGFELNLFGLVLGVDFRQPALKLPGVGRVPDA
ncbi:MAG: DUF3750 domain-containing protein [Rudaea sp.]